MSEPVGQHLKSNLDDDVLVLTITETQIQDESVADALLEEALAAIAHFRAQKVVVDFQHLKYISSVAFRPLLSIRRQLLASGGRMLLCGLSKVIGDVFYTTRLVDPAGSFAAPFEMEANVTAAVARLRSNGERA